MSLSFHAPQDAESCVLRLKLGATTQEIRAAMRWFVNFIVADLAAFRPGDWLNLAADCERLIGTGCAQVPCASWYALQQQLQWVSGASPVPTEGMLFDLSGGYLIQEGAVLCTGSFLSVMLRWFLAYCSADPEPLMHCSECNTLVYRDSKKRQFCGRRCVRRLTQRIWRRRHPQEQTPGVLV